MDKSLLLDKIKYEVSKKKADALIIKISNEHLQEMIETDENLINKIIDFTGDTATVLLYNEKIYLFVDGRFTIQAKNETKNNKRVEIVPISYNYTIFDFLIDNIKDNQTVALDYRYHSVFFVNKLKELFSYKNIKIKNLDLSFIKDEYKSANEVNEKTFIIDKKKSPKDLIKTKIKLGLQKLKEENNDLIDTKMPNICYITNDDIEIAYITGIRKIPNANSMNVVCHTFMIINNNKSYLYIKNALSEDIINYLKANNVELKKYENFYNDLKEYKKNNCIIFIDENKTNYFIYSNLNNKNVKCTTSPFSIDMAIRTKSEIANVKKANILDGVAIVKILYLLKKHFVEKDENATLKIKKIIGEYDINTEYGIKILVDNIRKLVAKKHFLQVSFETIVAYAENSAICHYAPSINKNLKINEKDNKYKILLIDSGAHYDIGTTDVTRTISLYKEEVPESIKHKYTMVLTSMLTLAGATFPYGYTGEKLDLLARYNLFKENDDYNHGTGHGIGYVTGVHDGVNVITRNVKDASKTNVIEANMISSCEPGVYYEGKYGIRIENDIVSKSKIVNGKKFMSFEHLTYAPFDRDLINVFELDNATKSMLNEYHKMVYNNLQSYLTSDEKKWLYDMTREV